MWCCRLTKPFNFIINDLITLTFFILHWYFVTNDLETIVIESTPYISDKGQCIYKVNQNEILSLRLVRLVKLNLLQVLWQENLIACGCSRLGVRINAFVIFSIIASFIDEIRYTYKIWLYSIGVLYFIVVMIVNIFIWAIDLPISARFA